MKLKLHQFTIFLDATITIWIIFQKKQMKSAILGTLALLEASSSLGSFLRVHFMGWTKQFPLINDSDKSAGRERECL